MHKRIVIITNDGNKFAGDIYKVDKTSPVIFGYPPHNTKQEFDEMEKLRLTYAITIEEIERWWSEEIKEKEETTYVCNYNQSGKLSPGGAGKRQAGTAGLLGKLVRPLPDAKPDGRGIRPGKSPHQGGQGQRR